MPRSETEVLNRRRAAEQRDRIHRARRLIEEDARILMPALDPPTLRPGFVRPPARLNAILDFLLSDRDRRNALRDLLAAMNERDGIHAA